MMHRRGFLALLLVLTLTACGGGGGGTGPVGPATVYVAIGASDAVGIGAFPSSDGYVPVFSRRLAAAVGNVQLVNLGENGALVDDMLADQLPAALASGPDYVTVWTGSNDLIDGADATSFGQKLDQLLGELRASTDAVVLVGNLVAMTETPRFRDDPDPDVTVERVAAFNVEIERAVEANACVLVPLYDLEVRDDLFWIDGFHPNNEGHERLADAYWAALLAR